ncbi:MAG: hypothetical protein PUJ07_05025 [Eubacteriales bacterium]|nr:hypothetical protein [Eubacteriales bacterium]
MEHSFRYTKFEDNDEVCGGKEKLTGGIPVLWLLNNDEVDPSWGKIARITV